MARRLALLLALTSAACSRSTEPGSPHPSHETAESRAQSAALEAPPQAPPATAPTASPTATEATPRPAFDSANPSAAGMRWTAPSGFTFHAPSSEMRLAEYVVGRANDADVTMTVFHFAGMGGSIDANLQRWIGQFTQPDGASTLAATHVASTNVGGLRVTTIDVRGHFEGGSMGGGSGDDHRLLGAIAEAPGGPVFFKLVGPRAVVDAAEPGFRALVASFARVSP